jgi:hypothetical protein
MVRMNFQIRRDINRIVIPSEVEESRGSTLWQPYGILRLRCASLTMTAHVKKPGSKIRSGFLKSYPADAVQADHPFPSVTGG